MYDSLIELIANTPDFQRTEIKGGASNYKQPVLPGEQRLVPGMREQVPPSLPPVRQAQMDPVQFLDTMLALYSSGGSGAISPDTARSLAAIEYMGRDRTTDLNPRVAADTIAQRSRDFL